VTGVPVEVVAVAVIAVVIVGLALVIDRRQRETALLDDGTLSLGEALRGGRMEADEIPTMEED
jgi:hypothetical protein